jgi:hypothetical protein
VASFKTLRTGALEVLKEISATLLQQSELESTADGRKALLDSLTIPTDDGVSFPFSINHSALNDVVDCPGFRLEHRQESR